MPVPVKVVVRSLLLVFNLEPEPPAKSHANPNITSRLSAAILSAAKDLSGDANTLANAAP